VAKKLAVIGAGAKAAAIAARAAVLRELTVDGVPDIIIFEAEHVGAAWSGNGRFTSGFLELCTPGEKDVGFPYDDSEVVKWRGPRAPIAPNLFARFSWSAFLVSKGTMSEWVDRGRNHPSHRDWAEYLEWVLDRAGQSVVYAKVARVQQAGDRWTVISERNGCIEEMVVDGVVLTGTGRARTVPAAPDMPANRIVDAETFWPARHSILQLQEGTIVVAGDGGGAGTVIAWLAEHFAENKSVYIQSVTPAGTLFPRGDGYAERRWFSDPETWPELSIEHRRKILDRTEAGVVSLRLKTVIDRAVNVGYLRGKAKEAIWDDDELKISIEYDGRRSILVAAQYLINAIGFDSWSLLELVDHPKARALRRPHNAAQREEVEKQILPDLTLPPISRLPPGLHVPALAGLACGPGMGNLGSLGLMAAAVLARYRK
jgi:mycobactin lysine-N-oxygenase